MNYRERPRNRKAIERILEGNDTTLIYIMKNKSYIDREGHTVYLTDGLVTQCKKMIKEGYKKKDLKNCSKK